MADKTSRKGLGAGLGALFGDDAAAEQKEVLTLPIRKVEPRDGQPRYNFDDEALTELSESIRQYGVIQPLTVRKLNSGYYQIIAGERRWRAARLAGLSEVPVRVIEADDRVTEILSLVENLQREDLSPIEEARGFRSLMKEYGLTQEEAAVSVGRSRPAVANSLRLLNLSPEVMALVESGQLSAGHARALIPIEVASSQLAAAQKVIAQGLSVRQTERLAAEIKKALDARLAPEPEPDAEPQIDYYREAEKELQKLLNRKVSISEKGKKGSLTIEFYGADDRDVLIANLRRMSGAWLNTF